MRKAPWQIYIAYLNTLTFACVQMVLYTTIPYIAEQTGVLTANIIAAISAGSFIFAKRFLAILGLGSQFWSFWAKSA